MDHALTISLKPDLKRKYEQDSAITPISLVSPFNEHSTPDVPSTPPTLSLSSSSYASDSYDAFPPTPPNNDSLFQVDNVGDLHPCRSQNKVKCDSDVAEGHVLGEENAPRRLLILIHSTLLIMSIMTVPCLILPFCMMLSNIWLWERSHHRL